MVVIFAAAFLAACGRGNSGQEVNVSVDSAQNAPSAVNVTRAAAVERELPAYISATGSLAANDSSDVASQIAGKVIATPVDVGAFVRQGDVIVRLNDTDARLRLQQANAAVEQAQANVRQAAARVGLLDGGNFDAAKIPEVLAAKANYQQLEAELRQAEANEKRYRDLVESGDVAMVLYEQYRTTRDTARAKVNSSKEQLNAAVNLARQSNQAVQTAQAAVKTAQTQVEAARTEIERAVIRAPFSGFVAARPVAVGEFITTSTPLLNIVRTNPIRLQMQVPEKEIPFVRVGMSVSLAVEAFSDRRFAGTVSAINPNLNNASRAGVVEATVDNSENLLRSGMFASARILREGGTKAVFVPKNAVLSDANTQSYKVFVVQDGKARLRVVRIGDEEGDEIRIEDGVNAGETVATGNLKDLYEGAPVIFE